MAALVVCARASVRDLYAPIEGTRVLSRGLIGLGLVALASPLTGARLRLRIFHGTRRLSRWVFTV